jgi:hypothetical protein
MNGEQVEGRPSPNVVVIWRPVPGKPSAQRIQLWDKLLLEKGGDESQENKTHLNREQAQTSTLTKK